MEESVLVCLCTKNVLKILLFKKDLAKAVKYLHGNFLTLPTIKFNKNHDPQG
jgi:hypothetical protein